MATQAAQVRLDHVGKRYGALWAVRQIDLEIEQGEFYTLLGPSGCGKTTLLRTIAGFTAPDEGAVYLDGMPVNHVPPWQRNIGMVFQHYALWPHMTVFENVAFGLRERKVTRDEITRRVRAALQQVSLQQMENRRPSELSGGQQQRVALARILVIQPRVLLLDEPLSNLDAKLRTEMRAELLKLQRDLGLTTIYVTHDQEEALALSTRIAVMNHGKIVQDGRPREIYEAPRDAFVADFVGRSNLFFGTVLHRGEGVIDIRTDEDFRVKARPPASSALPGPGAKVLVSIRPEVLEIIRGGMNPSAANRISGNVASSAYQGPFVEYEIEACGRPIKARVLSPKGIPLFQRGDEVDVVFSAENVGVISGDF